MFTVADSSLLVIAVARSRRMTESSGNGCVYIAKSDNETMINSLIMNEWSSNNVTDGRTIDVMSYSVVSFVYCDKERK